MATLTVKNVGPIRKAEFEVKKYTVFIGPQGSGKSTLAKLISMLSSRKSVNQKSQIEHNIQAYLSTDSSASFLADKYAGHLVGDLLKYGIMDETKTVLPQNESDISLITSPFNPEKFIEELKETAQKLSRVQTGIESVNDEVKLKLLFDYLNGTYKLGTEWSNSGEIFETYVPSERMLIALLSKSLWGLLNSDVSFPKVILAFASDFEKARNALPFMALPFLKVAYKHIDGDDLLTYESGSLSLSQSASGFQSIIPLLLVIEHQRQTDQRRFIIEEPELNLYPTAQKDLIYNLVSGLDPEKTYQDAEWVFTTHSPYVLSSFNTLMLAYKVGHQSEENRAKVEAIIPSRHWINPDDFAAYYVDGGTVESIISDEDYGLIDASRLDDVSDDFADEQEALFTLYRNALKVRA